MSAIDPIFESLAECPRLHAPTTAFYRLCKASARSAIESMFASSDRAARTFGPFGDISFPHVYKMGAIDSLDLFGLDELIIFTFYHANRTRYRRALDIGANLGCTPSSWLGADFRCAPLSPIRGITAFLQKI
jgi:hypothetical protein